MGRTKALNGKEKKIANAGAPATARTMTDLLYCAKGHRLPHIGPSGAQCTFAYCSDESNANRDEAPVAAREMDSKLVQQEVDDPLAVEANRISLAERRLAARLKALGTPETEDPVAIEEWADKEMVKMLKTAVSEVNSRLRWGDDRERWEAAQQVLHSTGRGKRGESAASASPIIMVVGDNSGRVNLPWSVQVVDQKKGQMKTLAANSPTPPETK